MKFAFRSMSMVAPEWFISAPNGGNGGPRWTQAEKDAVKACVATYKAKLAPWCGRPMSTTSFPVPMDAGGTASSIMTRPPGRARLYVFKPSVQPAAQTIRLKGLDATQNYRLSFEDRSQPPSTRTGAELMDQGLHMTLGGAGVSELVFVEIALSAASAGYVIMQ